MQEAIRRFRLKQTEQIPVFSSPIESFEYALSLAKGEGRAQIDIVTWALQSGEVHMYLPFANAAENKNIFSSEQIETDLLKFFQAHYPSAAGKGVRSYQFAEDAVHGEVEGAFSRSHFWEIPIGDQLVLGEISQVDADNHVQSRSYFIGKPSAERNLRLGQKIHRMLFHRHT